MAITKQKRLPSIERGEVLEDPLKRFDRQRSCQGSARARESDGATADTALRLARYFGVSALIWMNLQTKDDLAATEDALSGRIGREALPPACRLKAMPDTDWPNSTTLVVSGQTGLPHPWRMSFRINSLRAGKRSATLSSGGFLCGAC